MTGTVLWVINEVTDTAACLPTSMTYQQVLRRMKERMGPDCQLDEADIVCYCTFYRGCIFVRLFNSDTEAALAEENRAEVMEGVTI